MAVYSYTLKKYLRSKSTWIIIVLGMAISGLLVGILPWTLYKASEDSNGTEYAQLMLGSITGVTTMMALFTAVFSAFKAATMYKDEVEDGTFLVMLSKPQSRWKIIIMKWLSLQTISILFVALSMGSYVLVNVIFDDEPARMASGLKTFTSNSGLIFISTFGVLYLISLIFSSIGLLISTKTSTGATIGIGIALSVIIPITSLISVFTKDNENERLSNNNFENLNLSYKRLFGSSVTDINNLNETLTNKDYGLLNLGISNKTKDSYKYWSFLDLNMQIDQLASHATDSVLSPNIKEIASSGFGGPGGNSSVETVISKNNPFSKIKDDASLKVQLDTMFGKYMEDAKEFGFKLQIALVKLKDEYTSDTKGDPVDLSAPIKEEDKSRYVKIQDILYSVDSIKKIWKEFNHVSSRFENADPDKSDVFDQVLDTKDIFDVASKKYDVVANPTQDINVIYESRDGSQKTLIINQVSPDAKVYETLYEVGKLDKSALNMVENVPYINKWTLTWAYLLIAAALVPLSVLLVKRQDFR